MGMPPEWLVAIGPDDQVQLFLEAVDFQYERLMEGGFAHANVVVVLAPDLTVSGYLHGLAYTQEEVQAALRTAAGTRPLVERAWPLILVAVALALLATVLAIVFTARRRRPSPA
jgi:hypothetical protein